VKKWEILFLSKRTFLGLSMSNFLTKLAYVLQVATTPTNEHLEKKVRKNQIVNLKFVVSIYNYISMFRNEKFDTWFQIL
jgi:precorrin-3B methylase